MKESFYVYEKQYEPKCDRCEVADRLAGSELCEPCIHAMITPGNSPIANELLAEHIKKEGAE